MLSKTLRNRLLSLIQLGFLVGFGVSVWESNFLISFLIFVFFIFTLLPKLFKKHFEVFVPLGFYFINLTFIFAALILGEAGGFYDKFWWWDILLHGISGILIGGVGFLLTYVLNKDDKVKFNMSPFFIALFSFSFALSIGVIWEIFEYGVDYYFDMNMQKNGLNDTMEDLIVDTIGALTVSISAYFYLRKKKKFFLYRMFESVLEIHGKYLKQSKRT